MPARTLSAPWSLSLGGAPRFSGRLDDVSSPERSLEAICADLQHGAPSGRGMLCGGEPTTRADLLDVIRAVRSAGVTAAWLRTDGLALVRPSVCKALRSAGLDGVRVPLHSGRADAHDWLVGQKGAARRVRQAIQAAVAAGLQVEVEIALTRPTVPYLEETVALALRLGASGIWVRRLQPKGAAADQFIAVSPRLGLVRGPIEAALQLAEAQGASFSVEGIPRCVAPGADGRLQGDGDPASFCVACPGPPRCAGVPDDYTARFGWAEIWALHPRVQQAEVRLVVPPTEPTRAVRRRMLHAAQKRPDRLRLVDVGAHPEALSLLRDALRLSVPSVEVSGRADVMGTLSDTALFRLRGLVRVDVAAERPEAVPTLRALLARMHTDTQVSVYGLADSAEAVRAFEEAGADRVRLMPGGTLSALSGALAAPHLPPCLGGEGGTAQRLSEGPWAVDDAPTDWQGIQYRCPMASACSAQERCPGLPDGWDHAGIRPIA